MKTMTNLSILATLLFICSCATESSKTLNIQQTQASQSAHNYKGPKKPVIVGQFDNESGYMQGIFSDGSNRLGGQAKTILISHLQRTGRFSVMDRSNMLENAREAKFRNASQKIKGAKYTITGDVTEFGRKNTGDKQLFGILGSGKKQVAYSKVTLNVVNVITSEIVYSTSGAGEYALSHREIIGFGGTAGYDSTLNGKVLDLSIRQAVDGLIQGLQNGEWTI